MANVALVTLALAIPLAGILGWVSWRERPRPGTTAFAVGMLGLAWLLGCMLIGNTAEAYTTWDDVRFVFLRLKWVGTNLMVLGWFFFALAYSGRAEYITRRVITAASVVPAITTGILLANDRLIAASFGALGLTVSMPPLDFWGWWEPFDTTFIYALLVAGTVLIIGMILSHRMPHPEQAGMWLLAISIPWATNITYLAGILPPIGRPEVTVDPTPLAFLLTGTIGLAAITQYDSFSTAPVARTHVVDELRAGVLVFDDECRVVDVNDWVASVLELPADIVGDDIRTVLDQRFGLDEGSMDADAVADHLDGTELEVGDPAAPTYLRVEVSSLDRPQGLPIGYSMLCYDITEQTQYQQALERSNAEISFERDLKERIRDTLVSVSTQSEIEQAFCDSLVGDDYPLVWIGDDDPAGSAIRTVATHDLDVEGARIEELLKFDPAATALASDEVAVVDRFSDEEEANPAVEAGLRSAIVIPLAFQGITYGGLGVYAADIEAFQATDRRLLEELAESIGFAIHSAHERESLRSEQPMELTVDIMGSDTVLSSVATDAGLSEISLEASEVGTEGDTPTQFITVNEGDLAVVRDALRSIPKATTVEAISEDGDRLRVEATNPTIASVVADLGGAVRSMEVADGRARVIAEFSSRADIEQILDQLRDRVGETRLISRVYPERTVESRQSLEELGLTQKQADALKAAYFNGFFERPQVSTAAEVAETLDISRTTFLHHLRAAERRLLGDLLTEE